MSIIYPFPVLYRETLDYEDPGAYSAELRREGRTKVAVDHRLKADTLVGSLVRAEQAKFYCTVSVRGTAFRRTETVPFPETVAENGALVAQQRVEIPAFPWAPEVFASAGVVLLEEQDIPGAEAPGVSGFFRDGGPLRFPPHSRIAFGGWLRFFSMSALFHIQSDPDIEEGAFKTEVNRGERLQVSITMHPKLFDEIETNRESRTRAHILCAALTQAFQELHQAWQATQADGLLQDEADTRFLELAEGLGDFLRSKGIPTWEDDSFNPSLSASRCYKALSAEADDGQED